MAMRNTRQLLAVVFTDIADFSILAADDEDVATELVRQHDRLLRPLVKRFHGRYKGLGDGAMARFDSVGAALDCALEFQSQLKRWNRRHSQRLVIRVRVGVHVGDVVLAGRDILGIVPNVAKRLETTAPVGQVCCSDTVWMVACHRSEYRFRIDRSMASQRLQ